MQTADAVILIVDAVVGATTRATKPRHGFCDAQEKAYSWRPTRRTTKRAVRRGRPAVVAGTGEHTR